MKVFYSLIFFLFVNANFFSEENKPVTKIDDLNGTWEIYKVEPFTKTSQTNPEIWIGNKITFSKNKIQFLNSSTLPASIAKTDCDISKTDLKSIQYKKYSKFSTTKDSLKFSPEDMVSTGSINCLNNPYTEFIYHGKTDSIFFSNSIPNKSIPNLIFAKRISKPTIASELDLKLPVENLKQSKPMNEERNFIAPINFNFSDKAVEAIKELEAYRDYVYLDGNRNPIFGYGHLVAEFELQELKDKYGYEYYDEGTAKVYFQNSSIQPTAKEKADVVDMYLRKDLDIIIRNMRKEIKINLPQHKIDAITIYLFWRGSYSQNKEVNEFYQLVNSNNDSSVSEFMIGRMKKDSSGKDIPFLGGHFIRHRNTAKLYTNATYHDNWLIDN